ncbi:hypothetical protein DFH09DRAFT_1317734 [Mycena vulgaris]|nr:hypothetical protein DFH09DRAFT_1317734 [Mycena vulgaris]
MLALFLTTISSTPRLPLSFLPGTQVLTTRPSTFASSPAVPNKSPKPCQLRGEQREYLPRELGEDAQARGGVLHSRQRLPRASCLPGVPSSRRRPFVRRIRLLPPACTVRAGRMPACCACATYETKECPSVPRELRGRADSVPTALRPPSAAHRAAVVARLAARGSRRRAAQCTMSSSAVLHIHHGSYRSPPVACRARRSECDSALVVRARLAARGRPPRHAAVGAAQDPSGRSDGAHLRSRRAAANLCFLKPCSESLHSRASPIYALRPKASARTLALPRETRCVLPALIFIHLAASWIVRFRFLPPAGARAVLLGRRTTTGSRG